MSSSSAELQWPECLVPLKEVDNLLRCGICFEYFNIAMIIPQCSHNYCSLCIRKSLSYKAQCPTCCVAATGPDLKNNRILDELVQTFSSARQRLLQAVLDSPPVSPPAMFTKKAPVQSRVPSSPVVPALEWQKQFKDAIFSKENIHTPKRHLKLPEREDKKIKIKQEETPWGSEEAHETTDQGAANLTGGTKNPETPSTSATKVIMKVECPVCGVAVQEVHINKHLDGCLARDEKKDSLRSSGHTRKLLPKVVYNLLSDRDLRKRLKEYGLSTQGTKQQLIKRHQEFVHMYNSQCDSLNPKSVAEIVKELEDIEKTRVQLESSRPREVSMTFTKHQTENEIDEIHRDYRKKHKAEFQLLIDQMKKRKENASKIKIKEERPEENDATAEVLAIEIGEKQSVEDQTDQASDTNHSLKIEVVESGISEPVDWPDVRGLASTSSFQSSQSSNSNCADMSRKKAAPAEARKRTKEKITLEMKKEIIRKHDRGMRIVDIAREYGRNPSTISTILKMREKILATDVAKGVTRIVKNRPAVLEEVEKLLLIWMEEKQHAGDTVTEAVIREKAKALHADLIHQEPGTSAEPEVFKASRGWFERFKTRSGIYSVVRHGEAASSNVHLVTLKCLRESVP
uniref:RING-type E3 ubiquitin transferase n=1 Tax=Pogona vitticeps TaxID=103695 RepID=A0ABM5FJK1_9SAUR